MKHRYAISGRPPPLDAGPNPYLIEGVPSPSTKVTGDFSTERLTQTIHQLFGGQGEPEATDEDKENDT